MLVVPLGACSAIPTQGTIRGTMVTVGGPSTGAREALSEGTVTLAGHESLTLTIDSSGSFSADVPAGDYEVTGSSPQAPGLVCRASGSVRVEPGATTQVEVVCRIK